jgi:hypothetical protein
MHAGGTDGIRGSWQVVYMAGGRWQVVINSWSHSTFSIPQIGSIIHARSKRNHHPGSMVAQICMCSPYTLFGLYCQAVTANYTLQWLLGAKREHNLDM